VRLMQALTDSSGAAQHVLDVRALEDGPVRFLATLACPCCAAADTNLGSPPPGGAPPRSGVRGERPKAAPP